MENRQSKNNTTISNIIFESQLKPGETPSDETLVIPNIPTQERDIALGQYMDCFSRLEGALSMLFWKLLQTDLQTSNTIFYELGMKQIVSLLVATGRAELKEADQKRLESLSERISKCTMKRNHIIHGSWNPHISVGSKDGKPVVTHVEWVRSYTPTDPKKAKEALDKRNQKLNSKYHFTIPKMIEVCHHLVKLSNDISEFSKTLNYFPDPPHVRKQKESQE